MNEQKKQNVKAEVVKDILPSEIENIEDLKKIPKEGFTTHKSNEKNIDEDHSYFMKYCREMRIRARLNKVHQSGIEKQFAEKFKMVKVCGYYIKKMFDLKGKNVGLPKNTISIIEKLTK